MKRKSYVTPLTAESRLLLSTFLTTSNTPSARVNADETVDPSSAESRGAFWDAE